MAIIRFGRCFEYKDPADFMADEQRHCLPNRDDWWPVGKRCFGWEVEHLQRLAVPQPGPVKKGMISSRPFALIGAVAE